MSWWCRVRQIKYLLALISLHVKWFLVHIHMHAELHVHKTVMVGANFHCLIYNLLIAIIFPTYLVSINLSTSEYQQVGRRLIKAENHNNKHKNIKTR